MDPGAGLLKQIKARGLEQLVDWLDEGLREDLHLDFKRKAHPHTSQLSSDDKRNFSRALSGFANSDSGLIIWGIGAPGSGASERSRHPISPVRGFAENLDSQISRAVNPYVNGVENFVVYEDEQRDLGYVITYIPRSFSAPHRAEYEGLKQYYKRYGESFKICEHYELVYMFGQRQSPDLSVFWSVDVDLPHATTSLPDLIPARLNLGVTNQGKAIASYACMRLRYKGNDFYSLSSEEQSDLIHYSQPRKAARAHYTLITARALLGLVVYPGDYTYFFSFSFQITRDDLKKGKLPKFEVTYDLFAEDFKSRSHEHFSIRGKKICEKLRRKLESP